MLIDVVQYETCNHLKYSSILLVKLRILARTEIPINTNSTLLPSQWGTHEKNKIRKCYTR